MSKKLDDLIKAVETVLSDWRCGEIISTRHSDTAISGDNIISMHDLSSALRDYQIEMDLKVEGS